MKKVLKGLGEGLLKILSVFLIPLILILLVLMLPFILYEDWKRKKKLRSFLQQHDYSYFFIYTSGRSKRKFYEKLIIPTLNPGIEVIKYDGEKYNCFFESVTVNSIINPSEKGYPIIGKIEEGKVTTQSLKDEFVELVLKQKEVHQFNDLLQRKIDEL